MVFMKKKTGYLLMTLLLLTAFIVGCIDGEEVAAGIEVGTVDLREVSDGQYIGEYQPNKLVQAVVEVEVKNHSLTEIKLVEHDNWRGGKAEVIPERVLEAQSLEVDTVSGATVSSKTILKAVEIALKKGI